MTELNTPLTFKCTKNDGINEGDTRDYFDCEVFDSKLMVLLTLPDATIEESFTLQELIRRANAYDEALKIISKIAERPIISSLQEDFTQQERNDTILMCREFERTKLTNEER